MLTQQADSNKASEQHYGMWQMNINETRLVVATRLIMREKPGVLLDIACSAGEFTRRFIADGWQVVGIDNQEGKLAEAAEAGLDTHLCNIPTDAFPLDDSSIDCAFAGEIIEHLVDTDRFLLEIKRVLKPGGALVITTPNLLSLENRLRMLLGIYPRWVDYHCSKLGHIRAYTIPVLKRQLKDNGFRIAAARGNYIPVCNNQFMFLDDRKFNFVRYTGLLFPGLCGTIIVKARKLE
ncbi:class I SAM-dependent methyltransferase [Planctomycetota bacterium]